MAHVLFRHNSYAEIGKAQPRAANVQSDRIAVDMLARTVTWRGGFSFEAQIYLFKRRGEFKTN